MVYLGCCSGNGGSIGDCGDVDLMSMFGKFVDMVSMGESCGWFVGD